MAVQNTYNGNFAPRSVIANVNNAAIGIGLRVVITAGYAALAGATVRGDFVTLDSIEPGRPGKAVSMQSAGKMFFIAAVTIAVGDLIYSAASGQVTNVSAGGDVYVGQALSAGAANAAVEVEMQNPQ